MTDDRDSARPALSLLPDDLAALLSIPVPEAGMVDEAGPSQGASATLWDGQVPQDASGRPGTPEPMEAPRPALPSGTRPTTRRQARRFETRRDALVREIMREERRTTGLHALTLPSGGARRIALSALALGLVAAGLALGLRSGSAPGAGPTPASVAPAAAWSAIPGPTTPAQAASAAQVCRTQLKYPLGTSAARSARLVLAERRGAYTAVVMVVSGTSLGWCLFPTDDPADVVCGTATPEPFAAGREVSQYADTSFTGNVVVSSSGVVSASPGGAGPDSSSVVFGQVAPKVGKAVVETANGRSVQATVAGGWYFAWWPWIAETRSVTVYSASGAVLQTVDPVARPTKP